jgi:hypothetical protein
MVALPFAVVLAPADVDSCRPVEAGDSITGVKVEPEVADLEGHELGDAETADSCKSDHEPVSIVAHV